MPYLNKSLYGTVDAGNLWNIKKEITERGFEVSHFSEVVNEKYIGVNIVYDKVKDKLTLDQREYIEEMLTEYNMKDCNACYTPMTQETRSKKDTPEVKYIHLLDARVLPKKNMQCILNPFNSTELNEFKAEDVKLKLQKLSEVSKSRLYFTNV